MIISVIHYNYLVLILVAAKMAIKMAAESGGILMYRKKKKMEVFLTHPGGPYFKNRDEGWWTIPKGLPEGMETMREAAVREFHEETGMQVTGDLISLGSVSQKGGKIVHCWAFSGDLPLGYTFSSNMFEMEWPPKSGRYQQCPESDQGQFFVVAEALKKINQAQAQFLFRLQEQVGI